MPSVLIVVSGRLVRRYTAHHRSTVETSYHRWAITDSSTPAAFSASQRL